MIVCKICGYSAKRIDRHIKIKHGITKEEYGEKVCPTPHHSTIKSLNQYNKNKKNQNDADLNKSIEIILVRFNHEKILELYKTGHTPSIIAKHIIKKEFEDLKISDSTLRKIVKIICPYEDSHKKIHLRMPVWWRRKWEWNLDDGEAKKKNLEISRLQLEKIREKRKKSEFGYNKKYSLEYWMSTGLNELDASKKVVDEKIKRSPRMVQFWMRKGYSEEDATKKVSDVCAHGGTAATKKLHKKFTSNLENKIASLLDEAGILYERQFSIQSSSHRRIYDFKVGNLLIEVNGTYWHADPRVYKSNDFHQTIKKTAKQIWEQDEKNRVLAELNGYKVLVIWEIDTINLSAGDLKTMLENTCNL